MNQTRPRRVKLRVAVGALLSCAGLWATSVADVGAQVPAGPAPSAQAVLTSDQAPATVTVWNRSLAVFRASVGSRTPQERADAATARLETAIARLSPDQIRHAVIQVGADRGAIVFGDAEVLFAILEGDLPQDTATTLDVAGAQAVGRLQTLLRERTEQREWSVLIRSIIEALLAAVALGVFLLMSRRAVEKLLNRLAAGAASRIRDPGIPGVDTQSVVLSVLRLLIRLTVMAVRLAALYLGLTFIFSRFAYSRPWSERLGQLLIDTFAQMAAAVVDQIPNLVTLAMILFVTRAIAAATAAWFRAVERGDMTLSSLDPVAALAARRLAVISIWLFALTVAYPYVPGANTEAFKGLSVFVGLVLSLGSAGVVGQIMSGLFVTFTSALRPGDVVQVGDISGVVKNLGLVSVTLATRSKDEVTIPNTVIVTGAITNSSRGHSATFAMSTSVNVGYDTPWRQVQALLLLAAARTDGVQQAPAPTVFQTALSDFYITYELVAYGDATASRPVVLSRLHERILDVFNEHGVQIMSPNFEAQPDRRVVVDPSQWFADPATHPDRRSDS